MHGSDPEAAAGPGVAVDGICGPGFVQSGTVRRLQRISVGDEIERRYYDAEDFSEFRRRLDFV